MNDDDRLAMLNAMYQDDTDVESVKTTQSHPFDAVGRGKSRHIRVGAIQYEIPTVEYVQHLEQLIMQQNETLLLQRRMIDRMATMLNRTRSAQSAHRVTTDALRRELNTKLTIPSSHT